MVGRRGFADSLPMRRLLAAIAVATLPFGCTSILGDFSTGSGGGTEGGTADGAPDATNDTTTDGTSDGGAEASDAGGDRGTVEGGADAAPDGPPPVLTCDTWRYGTPIQVVSLEGVDGGQRTLAAQPIVLPGDSQDTTVVVVSPPPNDFQVYAVSMSMASVQHVTQSTPHGSIDSFFTTEDGVAVITPDTMGGADLVATDIPATIMGNGMVPSGTELTPFPGFSFLTSWGQQLAVGSYAYAYSNSPSSGQYGLYAGLSGSDAGAVTITTSANRSTVDSPELVNANGQSFIFVGGDGSSGSGPTEYVVPDDSSAMIQGPRTITSTGSDVALMLGVGPNSSPSRVNLAFADGNLSTQVVTLRIGSLDVSQANSFSTASLPMGETFTTLADLPTNGSPHWQGDDFLAIGQGQGAAGANFLWVDVDGNTRGVAYGANAILTTDTNLSQINVSFSSQVPSVPAAFDVTWSDRLSDGSGEYDVVYVNQLQCH
jgi:hypothetical protein